ncbi:hypothetical protein [Empedobacter brevis]|uniref:hypothetical protein n=1 Tax=Empedobacter brevis TaxID=247 RepID=UPI0023F3B55D|nr:hypothetical protein [Empedobacter brevis]
MDKELKINENVLFHYHFNYNNLGVFYSQYDVNFEVRDNENKDGYDVYYKDVFVKKVYTSEDLKAILKSKNIIKLYIMNLEIKKTINQKLLLKKSYIADQSGIDFNVETKYLTLLDKNGFVKQDMKVNGQSVIGSKYDLTDKGADFINIFQDLINI